MIHALYERLTGRPWTTTRSATAEYGPPPGAIYAHHLAAYTDAELITAGEQILAHLRTRHPTTTGGPAARARPPRRPLPATATR
jgi:hypothetical protein